MKAQEIFEQVKKQHSNTILNAEIIEQHGIVDATVKFEDGKHLQIYYNSNRNYFESSATLWGADGNTKLIYSTIENFDEILFDSLIAPKPIIINEIICQYRKKQNITQTQLSEKINVRTATISEFESGKHALGSDKLEAIMNELGLTISKLHGSC